MAGILALIPIEVEKVGCRKRLEQSYWEGYSGATERVGPDDVNSLE